MKQMHDLKDCLAKQLDSIDDREINYLFNSYNTDDLIFCANEECTKYFRIETLIAGDIYYNGDGCTQYSVYKFTYGSDEFYVRFFGSYQSYIGENYHGWKFVEPKQQVITVYE